MQDSTIRMDKWRCISCMSWLREDEKKCEGETNWQKIRTFFRCCTVYVPFYFGDSFVWIDSSSLFFYRFVHPSWMNEASPSKPICSLFYYFDKSTTLNQRTQLSTICIIKLSLWFLFLYCVTTKHMQTIIRNAIVNKCLFGVF